MLLPPATSSSRKRNAPNGNDPTDDGMPVKTPGHPGTQCAHAVLLPTPIHPAPPTVVAQPTDDAPPPKEMWLPLNAPASAKPIAVVSHSGKRVRLTAIPSDPKVRERMAADLNLKNYDRTPFPATLSTSGRTLLITEATHAAMIKSRQRVPEEPVLTTDPLAGVGPRPLARPRAKEFLLERSGSNVPGFGHPLAKSLLLPPADKTAARDNTDERQPITVTKEELRLLKRPFACVPFSHDLSLDAAAVIDAEAENFAVNLSTDDERQAFAQGRRLLRKERNKLLRQFSKKQRAHLGLRFADEKSCFTDSEVHAAARESPSIETPPWPRSNTRRLLMWCWHYCDPLLLDHAADVWREGVNIAFNGKHVQATNRNMTSTDEELRQAADVMVEEVTSGRAVGFYPVQQFPTCFTVPFGLTPKKDGSARPIDNFSAGGGTSVNARSDEMEMDTPPFNKAVMSLHEAGSDGWLLGWDAEKAFNSNDIRAQDQALTVTRLPARAFAAHPNVLKALSWPPSIPEKDRFVYCHRRACPFGLRASGYRWHVSKARPLMSVYHILQYRLEIADSDLAVKLLPDQWFKRSPTKADPMLTENATLGILSSGSDDFITPLGRQRLGMLAALHPRANVDLDSIARNTDDFFKGYRTLSSAKASAAAVVFIHAALQVRLKESKFTHVTKAADFHGFDFIVPRTISYDHDKRAVLCERLDRVAAGKPSIFELESAIGTALYASMIYSQLRGSFSPLFAALDNVQGDISKMSKKARQRRVVTCDPEAINSARLISRVVRSGPVATSSAVRVDSLVTRATAVAHTDYAGSTRSYGGVVLSHGLFFSQKASEFDFSKWGSSIPTMEARAVVRLLALFGPQLAFGVLVLFTDSIVFIQSYERYFDKPHLSASPGLAQALRDISALLIQHSIVMHVEFVPSKLNVSDPLSRHDVQAFKDMLGSLHYPAESFKQTLFSKVTTLSSTSQMIL